MAKRLTKIYTRVGDDGTTMLGDANRAAKDDIRIEVMGDLDELNSIIGVVLTSNGLDDRIQSILTNIQHELFDIGAEICIPQANKTQPDWVKCLEATIDEFNSHLPPLEEFILPGGAYSAALCHFARTICRRAERHLVTLQRQDFVNPVTLQYINRLSDLLFVAARTLNQFAGVYEKQWQAKRG